MQADFASTGRRRAGLATGPVAGNADARALDLRRAARALLILSLPLLLAAMLMPGSLPRQLPLAAGVAGLTLLAIAAGVGLWSRVPRRRPAAAQQADWTALLEGVPQPAIITTDQLAQAWPNAAALDLAGTGDRNAPLRHGWLSGEWQAAMRAALDPRGAGRSNPTHVSDAEDGQWALSPLALPGGATLWRFDPVAVAGQAPAPDIPVLGLGRADRVLYLNGPARALFGGRPRALSDLPGAAGLTPGTPVRLTGPRGELTVLPVALPAGPGRREIALLPLGDREATAAGEPDSDRTEDWERFENLPVPLLRLSHDGRVQRANRNAIRLIGPDCREGAHLGDLTEGLGRPIADWLEEAVSGYRAASPEFLRVTGSNRETFVQITLKPMKQAGEPSLLAVLSDATELKTLEAQFVQSQKMQAIGQLAGGVAHDFNNLLTAISGHCDLLMLRHDQGDPDYADLMQINQNANRAASLVSQLLAFSRKQTLRPEQIDLRETISDLTHLLNRLVGEKITLSFSHDPMLHAIRADKRQLEQVLMNLVVNARDAIPGGGEIRIVTEGVHLDDALARDRATVPPGDYVSVKVIDTGCGIPPDKLQKVFEPFFTTKRVGEGTGLGLSTAYGIMKQTGGYIFVDSTLGEGTCFTLLFRAFREAPQPPVAKSPEARQNVRHADGVVLLVEDEAPVRAFASRALRLRGYTVLEAESGEQALEILGDPALKVDIFVTDVVMPGIDGPTWVRRAIETRPDVRVIFVSGYAEEHFSDGQVRIPNSCFLPKPFSLSELTQTVQGLAV